MLLTACTIKIFSFSKRLKEAKHKILEVMDCSKLSRKQVLRDKMLYQPTEV